MSAPSTVRSDLRMGMSLLTGVPRLLRHPVTLDEARAVLTRRLANRDHDFLEALRHGIYGNPRSPFSRLLTRAGCQLGDVERLVGSDGVEAALRVLLRAGIYLTVEELKGRRPVARAGLELRVDPGDLTNPRITPTLAGETSGSRGPRVRVATDLAHLREGAVDWRLILTALAAEGAALAVWGVPGSAAMDQILQLTAASAQVTRWFSQVDPDELHARYRLSAGVMRAAGRLAGLRLPRVEHVSPEDPLPIARWMVEQLRSGVRPHLLTFSSSGVRLCRDALEAGLDLHGARLWMTGEPITKPGSRWSTQRARSPYHASAAASAA